MNSIETLLLVIAIIAFAGFAAAVFFPWLKKKGIDVGAVLVQVKDALTVVDDVMDAIKPFLASFDGMEVYDNIMAIAKDAVTNVEQLYQSSQLPPEQRKETAKQYVKDSLALLGVEVTEEIERVIEGAIECEVFEFKKLYGLAAKPPEQQTA